MKVLLSSGVGRLHFIETAKALSQVDVDYELICGYVPKHQHRHLLNLIGPILGRPQLADRLNVRLGGSADVAVRLRSNGWAEALTQLAFRLSDWRLLPRGIGQSIGWKYFGYRSRRYLKGQSIFHVRSGAGQGGAIAAAKRLGMVVIVDHSIAHPLYMESVLSKIFSEHDVEFDLGLENPFWRTVLADCVSADILLVNSDFVKETFIAAGYSAEKIRVNYLGVREDFYGIKNCYDYKGPLKLLFTGSFELRKGADVLLAAVKNLRARGVACELHIAGPLGKGNRLSEGIADPGVIWHGPLLQDALKNLLRNSDLYVFPSYAEGSSRAAMEAMFAGLPVVATRATGLPGVAGQHFLQIREGSVADLCDAVEALRMNYAQRRRLGELGISLARSGQYRWSEYGSRLSSIYKAASRSI